MKSIPPVLLLILTSLAFSNKSISQNALDFDGVDDRLTVPAASAFIAGSSLSLGCWVYPTNPAPSYPDFDGIAGFRNDINADFYMLQLNAGTIEARFRNSNGTMFEILFNGLQLNAWNHILMTYDGSELSFYHNGIFYAATPANGYIISAFENLNIGFTPFLSPDFLLDGILDDVCLWNKALNGTEALNLFQSCSVNLADTSLKLCFEFNQGVAGGNNTGITTAFDSKGNINGNLLNFSMTSTTGNFVDHSRSTSALVSMTACNDYQSPSGLYTWTTTGNYTDTLTNASGCDSIIYISLIVQSLDTSVTVTSPMTLLANAIGMSYQWLDCNAGFTPLPGDTSQAFIATSGGSFAVVIDNGTCADTSACYSLIPNSVSSQHADEIKLWPNPAAGILMLTGVAEGTSLRLFNALGELALAALLPGDGIVHLPSGLKPGIYFMAAGNQYYFQKIIILSRE